MHPVLFSIGSFNLYSYGAAVALAALLAWGLAERAAARAGFKRSDISDLALVLFVSGVAGARLFFVVQHWQDYRDALQKIFILREGGLVWYGGFLAAATAGLAMARRRGWSARVLADLLAGPLAFAHAIGRVGCYMNGCCFGRRGLPVQLIEAAGLAVLGLFLMALSKRPHARGAVFAWYAFIYSAGRFALEFIRGDQTLLGPLTAAQWTSAAIFAAASVYLAGNRGKNGKV